MLRRLLLVAALTLVAALVSAGAAGAQVGPPWCDTPAPDAAENLPDGTDPSDPVGSFPHIPYYAIGCTLDALEAQANGRLTVEVIGESALGRDMYGVVVNALDTPQQRKAFQRWEKIRGLALEDPAQAQAILERWGDDVKIPVYVQAGIHGNEYEGVDAAVQLLEKLATAPYGADPRVDDVLDHVILVVDVVQNPDGRIAGTRANGNGFDLNRDFLTQSQPETRASVALMQEWLPTTGLDLHGYTTPTLAGAATKPHNPGLDYDLILKWNQARLDANETAMNGIGQAVQRPMNDWCPSGGLPGSSGLCAGGIPPGPAVAQGWDDWGPFYTVTYMEFTGVDASTVEMCNQTDFDCGVPGSTTHERGRSASRTQHDTIMWSTLAFDVSNRQEKMHDQLEIFRRGVTDAPRPACCDPYEDQNWMVEYPQAYVIPVGAGQRSDAEASRLVEWLLLNGIEVEELRQPVEYGGAILEKGSYVVYMDQALRGIAETALSVGVDVSGRITQLYAPPGAWSHGYLWGADVLTIPDGAPFTATSQRIKKPATVGGGVEPGPAGAYALELDSPTAVRVLNELVGGGLVAELALAPFATVGGRTLPAGTVLFAGDHATRVQVATAGRENGLTFRRIASEDRPATDPVTGVPRIAVLTGAVNQDVWSLRNLGFPADPVSTATINSAPTDPLVGYDVVWNTGNWPGATQTTARERLTAFFAAGGGYLGAGANGANFLTAAGQAAGLTAATRSGSGRSGTILWRNEGGAASPIVGAYPAQDTAIVDPPTWFSAVPSSLAVDARLLESGFFLSGLWPFDEQSAGAPGSPLVVHGLNNAGTARLTAFAMNPLYRADPEREWPMVGAAAYWADQ